MVEETLITEDVETASPDAEAVKAYLNNGEYKKIIYIPNKIFNIVV